MIAFDALSASRVRNYFAAPAHRAFLRVALMVILAEILGAITGALTDEKTTFLYKEEMGLSPNQVTTLNFLLEMPALMQPFIGAWTDLFPWLGSHRRSYYFLGILISVLGMGSLAILPHYHYAMVAGLMLASASGGVLNGVVFNAVIVSVGNRTGTYPRLQVLSMVIPLALGTLYTSHLSGFVTENWSYPRAFGTAAVLSLLYLPLIFLMIEPQARELKEEREDTQQALLEEQNRDRRQRERATKRGGARGRKQFRKFSRSAQNKPRTRKAPRPVVIGARRPALRQRFREARLRQSAVRQRRQTIARQERVGNLATFQLLLTRRRFWAFLLFIGFVSLTPSPVTAMDYYKADALHLSKQFMGDLGRFDSLGTLAGLGLAWVFSKRVQVRHLVWAFCTVNLLNYFCYLAMRGPVSTEWATFFEACFSAVGSLCSATLVARACPPGLEATVWGMIGAVDTFGFLLCDKWGSWMYEHFGPENRLHHYSIAHGWYASVWTGFVVAVLAFFLIPILPEWAKSSARVTTDPETTANT